VPVRTRIHERLDQLKDMGQSNIDARDMFGDTDNLGNPKPRDIGFTDLTSDGSTSSIALCPLDGTEFDAIRNARTDEIMLICPTCGRYSNPRLDPVEYETRVRTKEGLLSRKGTTAKSTNIDSDVIESFVDEVDRDLYKGRNSLFSKRTVHSPDEKLLEKQSGVTVTDVQEVRPDGK
jgi:hypothetical protein